MLIRICLWVRNPRRWHTIRKWRYQYQRLLRPIADNFRFWSHARPTPSAISWRRQTDGGDCDPHNNLPERSEEREGGRYSCQAGIAIGVTHRCAEPILVWR